MDESRFSASSAVTSPAVRVDSAGEDSKPLSDQSLSGRPTDGWEKCWQEGFTPWDLGQTTPIIAHLIQTSKLPEGRTLVPGCGMGYDVVAMASPLRFVVGLDVSVTALNKAKEWSSSSPNARYFTFIEADFFTWTPTPPELFDVIFDYTFFCAIQPSMRSAWASKLSELLKPDGELITLMHFICDREVGPPHNNTVADYVEALSSVGFKLISIVDNELAVERRKGTEKLGRWKKS